MSALSCNNISDDDDSSSLITQEPYMYSSPSKDVTTSSRNPTAHTDDFFLNLEFELPPGFKLPPLEPATPQPHIAATFEAAFGVASKNKPTRRSSRIIVKKKVGPHYHLNVAQTIKVKKMAAAASKQQSAINGSSKPRKKKAAKKNTPKEDMVGLRVYAEFPKNEEWYWGIITGEKEEYNAIGKCYNYEVLFDDNDVAECWGSKIYTIPEYEEHRAVMWPHLVNEEPPEKPVRKSIEF
jgi:hypothetical protein